MKRSLPLLLLSQTTPSSRRTRRCTAAAVISASEWPSEDKSIKQKSSVQSKTTNTNIAPSSFAVDEESALTAADASNDNESNDASSLSMHLHPGLVALEKDVDDKLTPFQKRVLTTLCRVPAGQVTTYKILGKAIQCNSGQAIGQALRRNPYAPMVPCHRVVAHDRSLGGFCGQTAGAKLVEKIQLLQNEGVVFETKDAVTATNTTTRISKEQEPQPSQLRVAKDCLYEFQEE